MARVAFIVLAINIKCIMHQLLTATLFVTNPRGIDKVNGMKFVGDRRGKVAQTQVSIELKAARSG